MGKALTITFAIVYWVAMGVWIPFVNILRLPIWYLIETVEMFKKAKMKYQLMNAMGQLTYESLKARK